MPPSSLSCRVMAFAMQCMHALHVYREVFLQLCMLKETVVQLERNRHIS